MMTKNCRIVLIFLKKESELPENPKTNWTHYLRFFCPFRINKNQLHFVFFANSNRGDKTLLQPYGPPDGQQGENTLFTFFLFILPPLDSDRHNFREHSRHINTDTEYLLQQYKNKYNLLRFGLVFQTYLKCDQEVQGMDGILNQLGYYPLQIDLSINCPLRNQKTNKKKWNLFFTLSEKFPFKQYHQTMKQSVSLSQTERKSQHIFTKSWDMLQYDMDKKKEKRIILFFFFSRQNFRRREKERNKNFFLDMQWSPSSTY